MAAKGAILKKEISQKILELFNGTSFLYNDGKEIRINGFENGEPLQIKITLTAAKVAVEGGTDNQLPGEKTEAPAKTQTVKETIPQEPTQDEKERLARLLESLGMN